MHLSRINFQGFKSFQNTEIYFPKENNINIFIGSNGGGKSSVLDGISISLSWLATRLYAPDGNKVGFNIDNLDINNDSLWAEISATATTSHNEFRNISWSIIRHRYRMAKNRKSNFLEITNFGQYLNTINSEFIDESNNLSGYPRAGKVSLPSLMYYGVGRGNAEVPLRNKNVYAGHLSLEETFKDSLDKNSNLRKFFEWIEIEENLENERIVNTVKYGKNEHPSLKNSHLEATKNAIEKFLGGFSNLRVQRSTPKSILIDKDGTTLNILQLSHGEKSLLSLVGDIAKNLSLTHENSNDVLSEPGIVLIDEIDLHLHPRWQAEILSKLSNTFPNCQFFITTHSPLILSNAKEANIYLVQNSEIKKIENSFGESSDFILNNLMDSPIRDGSAENSLKEFRSSIASGNLDDARQHLSEIKEKTGVSSNIYKSSKSEFDIAELLQGQG